MSKSVIPNSALILYSKGWISFRRKHPDWNIKNEMQEIVKMCDYIPYKNPTAQIILLFDRIIEFLKEWNINNPQNPVNIPACTLNIYNWENEVNHTQLIYNYIDRDDAVIHTIISVLSMLDIRPFDVEKLNYNKKNGYTISLQYQNSGITYKTMQWKFNKTFFPKN